MYPYNFCTLRNMAILSSSPTRRYGATKRRNTSVLTVLLLVLSHNVWNTLQCVTSSSHPKNPPPPPPRRTSSSEDDLSASTSASNEVFESEEAIDRNRDFEKKSDGNGGANEGPAHEEPFQACQNRLLDNVKMICGQNNFYAPQLATGNTLPEILGMSKRSAEDTIIQRRMTRSLVNECCNKGCTRAYMVNFCRDRTRVVMTTTTTMRPLIEDVRMRTEFVEPQIFDAEETRPAETHPELPELPLPPNNAPVAGKPGEPGMYYPLIHFLKFIQHQFGDKNANQGSGPEGREDVQPRSSEQDGYQELPRPEARVQSAYPNSQTYRHHSHQQHGGQGLRMPAVNQFSGGLVEVAGENAGRGDRAFTNSAVASHHSNHHSNHRQHHHHPSPTNTHDININQLNSDMQHYLQRQQAPRKSSVNILTSTIPPVTLIRLGPITDYEAPYVNRK